MVRVPMSHNDTLKRVPVPPREFAFKVACRFSSAPGAAPAIDYRYVIVKGDRTDHRCIAEHAASTITDGKNPQSAHTVHHHRNEAVMAARAGFSPIAAIQAAQPATIVHVADLPVHQGDRTLE